MGLGVTGYLMLQVGLGVTGQMSTPFWQHLNARSIQSMQVEVHLRSEM